MSHAGEVPRCSGQQQQSSPPQPQRSAGSGHSPRDGPASSAGAWCKCGAGATGGACRPGGIVRAPTVLAAGVAGVPRSAVGGPRAATTQGLQYAQLLKDSICLCNSSGLASLYHMVWEWDRTLFRFTSSTTSPNSWGEFLSKQLLFGCVWSSGMPTGLLVFSSPLLQAASKMMFRDFKQLARVTASRTHGRRALCWEWRGHQSMHGTAASPIFAATLRAKDSPESARSRA